jgi:hypothetical protein
MTFGVALPSPRLTAFLASSSLYSEYCVAVGTIGAATLVDFPAYMEWRPEAPVRFFRNLVSSPASCDGSCQRVIICHDDARLRFIRNVVPVLGLQPSLSLPSGCQPRIV